MRTAVSTRDQTGRAYGFSIIDDDETVKIKEVRVFEEYGSVQLWVNDMLAYLAPIEAMGLAAALERNAFAALKASGEKL